MANEPKRVPWLNAMSPFLGACSSSQLIPEKVSSINYLYLTINSLFGVLITKWKFKMKGFDYTKGTGTRLGHRNPVYTLCIKGRLRYHSMSLIYLCSFLYTGIRFNFTLNALYKIFYMYQTHLCKMAFHQTTLHWPDMF